MPIPIHDSQIEVYLGHDKQAHIDERPDVTIPSGDITEISISARIDEVMDEASISLDNRNGRYTEEYPLQTADRIVYRALIGPSGPYGGGYYGGSFYGGAMEYTWTGRIVDTNVSKETPTRSMIDIEAQDYVADILSNRQITNSYVDRDVGHIIRDIVDRKAPEVDASRVPDFGVSTDIKYSSAGCWDAILGLAARADAITIPDGQSIRIDRIDDLPRVFDLEPNDYYLPLVVTARDDIKNIVRVDSGENRKVESVQDNVDPNSFVTVKEGTRITHRLRARKSQVHSVELYIGRVGTGDITVRLQSDEDGSPIEIGDEDSDIVSTTWQAEDLDNDSWKTFFFDEHTLADRDPWLIIESGATGDESGMGDSFGYGENGYGDGGYGGSVFAGQQIGHNASGELAYRSFYPHQLNFEVSSPESIREYGAREKRIERANLKTLSAARDAARAELAKTAWPSKTVEIDIASPRGHSIQPGDRMHIEAPEEGVVGEHIISEVTDTWSSGNTHIKTSIVADWRKGVLAPQ